MATLYSAYATILFILGGDEAFAQYDTTFATVIVTYYAAGLLGGIIVGVLLPITENMIGQITVGVIVAFVVFFCFTIAMVGPISKWRAAEWKDLLTLALIMGIPGSVLWRKFVGRF